MLICLPFYCTGQQGTHKVYATGNFADLQPDSPFYQALEAELSQITGPFTLLLNGDLEDPDVESENAFSAEDPVLRLLELVEGTPQGRVIIVPGDRDWGDSKRGGYKEAIKLQAKVEGLGLEKITWAVPDGCPGPKLISLDKHLVMIAINTQWWNHPFDKPHADDADCKITSTADVMEEIDHLIEEHQQKNILLAGHYPVVSYGNYGGYFSVGQHLSPFPIAAEFKTGYRANVGGVKDISNERFGPFAHGIQTVYYEHQGLIYVSAHEKNQQVIRKRDDWFVNSGAPEKAGFAARGKGALLSESVPGVMLLEFEGDGSVSTTLLAYDPQSGFSEHTSIDLFQPLCEYRPTLIETPISRAAEYCVPDSLLIAPSAPIPSDTFQRLATTTYLRKGVARIFVGKHWREAWATPISTQYLDIDTAFGGLKIFEKGGGRQTTSLKFNAKDGSQYVFRSINKNPERALDYTLRNTIVRKVAKDITSTQHPYGALVVDPLLNELDILHAHPQVYVLPDVPQLGIYQTKYGDLFGMLEDKPGKANQEGEHFGGADKILKSNKLFRTLYKSPKNAVDQDNFIRARLFDMWVGDWSKHPDNWKWAGYQQNGRTIYKPIPRDRDHVFSRWDGLVYWVADREWAIDKVQDFGFKLKGIRSLNGQAKHLDRLLANATTREDWIREATFIQDQVSQPEIEAAVRTMPAAVYENSGVEIQEKLEARKTQLVKFADAYYDLLAKEVEVLGTGKKDYFEVHRSEDGSVRVAVYTKRPENPKRYMTYDRTFLPEETKEIRLYGLGGGDVFQLTGTTSKSIRIRIISGAGDDEIQDSSKVRGARHMTLVYDRGKRTQLTEHGEAKRVDHWNPELYYFKFDRFEYDSYLPLISLSYDQFNGFMAGGGFQYAPQKWDKEGYASKHKLTASVSTLGNKGITYNGRFHHLIRKWDLELGASVRSPEYHNRFFGVGNETVLDQELYDNTNFYELEYNQAMIKAGIYREFWQKSSVSMGVWVERNNVVTDTTGGILGVNPDLLGIVHPLLQVGPYAKFDLDLRDKIGLPTKGVRAYVSYDHNFQLMNSTTNYGMAQGFLEYYVTHRMRTPLTLGIRVGGATSLGTVPFYKMVSLGSDRNLRGFDTRRFTGTGNAYLNSELRWEIINKDASFIPFQFGFKGFYDIGRVFFDENEGNIWHYGYGGGVYVAPFSNRLNLSVTVGFSQEQAWYPLVGLGGTFK